MGKKYENQKAKIGTNQFSNKGVEKIATPQKTADKIAEEFGVDEKKGQF